VVSKVDSASVDVGSGITGLARSLRLGMVRIVGVNYRSPASTSVIGVSALNRLARDLIERSLPLMWVRGEISNFTCAASGHCYFTLKDAAAQVRCAMFRQRARLLDWQPRNGIEVEVRALVTLYESRGEFQLNVETMRRAGMGALYEAFERLKAKLGAEGLFDADRKRDLPAYPRAIGIVTSPQAAALRDVLTVLAARMPSIPVVVYPTPVQGAGAGERIAEAIRTASARNECDVLIVCRGGGSIEDLWAFNEEEVARSIRACAVPVVSGVGHETDFTIADFAADLRAPTPTAAAQAVSPDRAALVQALRQSGLRIARALERRLDRLMQDVDYLGRRLLDPRERLRANARQLQQLAARLAAAWAQRGTLARYDLLDLVRRLLHARFDAKRENQSLREAGLRLDAALRASLQVHAAALGALGARLQALNPHAVLERGYAIATDQSGRVVRDAARMTPGDRLDVRLAHGILETQIVARVAEEMPPRPGAPPTEPRR